MSDVHNTTYTATDDEEFLTATANRVEADAVADVARQAADPKPLPLDTRLHVVQVPAGGSAVVIDTEDYLDIYRDRPRRKRGTFHVTDADSLLRYLSKHGETDETEVWADLERHTITAVINAHTNRSVTIDPTGSAGHGDHRAVFSVKHTDAWKRWTQHDGKLMNQSDFAELIEDGAAEIARPSSADMLELAQTFQATIGVNFESSKQLSSGERQLEYRETVDAKAGRAGQLEIPKDFDLALAPFEGADAYRVLVRFRYRIADGALRVGYRLDRPDLIVRNAFLDVINVVADGCEHPVFRGTTG